MPNLTNQQAIDLLCQLIDHFKHFNELLDEWDTKLKETYPIPTTSEDDLKLFFGISFLEYEEAERWLHTHDCINKTTNDKFSYIFTPAGGIGMAITIRCNVCDNEHDITDYSRW